MQKNAYLQLKKTLIHKNNLINELNKYDKVCIYKQDNKNLNDENVIKIRPSVNINLGDLKTIIGSCVKHAHLHDFIAGVVSTQNTINYKVIKKLIELETQLDVNLSISNNIKKLIK